MSKVYLVIFDGYMDGYGSYSYLLGAYDTKDKAEEAVKTLPVEVRDDDWRVAIQEIEVNKTHEIKKTNGWVTRPSSRLEATRNDH